ncbi:MAG: NINE protein [Gemmatimonadales bacterium]
MALPEPYDSGDYEAADSGPEVSVRSRTVALLLGFVGGILGLHRFYVGKPGSAVAMIVTLGGLGIWWLYDMVLIVAGEFRDAKDLPLRSWGVEDARRRGVSGHAERRLEELEDRCESLRTQLDDLAERVDFAERMLAQQRERPSLPPSARG